MGNSSTSLSTGAVWPHWILTATLSGRGRTSPFTASTGWRLPHPVQGHVDHAVRRQRRERPKAGVQASLERRLCGRIRQANRQGSLAPPARPLAQGHVTPMVIEVAGKSLLISAGGDVVQAFNADTGDLVWTVKSKGEGVVPSIVHGQGLVFTASGYEAPTMRAIKPDGKGDVTATHIAWESRDNVSMMPSFIYTDGLLFCVKESGIAVCLDAANGKALWQQRRAVPTPHRRCWPRDAFTAWPRTAPRSFLRRHGNTRNWPAIPWRDCARRRRLSQAAGFSSARRESSTAWPAKRACRNRRHWPRRCVPGRPVSFGRLVNARVLSPPPQPPP